MIDSKSDIIFVSENALKNISVAGAQYPVRGGKLALLGEDVAVLEEAIRERSLYLNDTGFNNEFSLPSGHPIPSGSTRAGGDAVQSRAQYDQRIREIRRDVDDEYSRIKALLANGNWIDKDKAAEIEAPENPIIKCTGNILSSSDYNAAKAQFDSIIAQCSSDLSSLSNTHNQALSDLQSAYEAAVAAENARFAEDGDIQAANAAYTNAVQGAEEEHAAATNAEETLNAGNVAAINRRLEDEEITQDEADELLAREAERHGFEVEKTDNRRIRELAAAALTRDKAIIRATEAHFDTLKDLEDGYDEDVADENEEYENSRAALIDARDDAITTLGASIPDLMDYIYDKTHGVVYSKAWRRRDEAFQNAVIRKSCADVFYSRNPLFKPSSTAINRIYADLEHMDDVFGKGVSLWREKRIYTYGGSEYEPDYPSNSQNSYGELNANEILIIDEDYVGTYDNYDFFFFYGHRHEIDHIYKIYADAILYRHDHWSARAQRLQRLAAGEEAAAAMMDGVGSNRWRFENGYNMGQFYERIVIYDTSGMTAEELEAAEAKAQSANEMMAEAFADIDEITDKCNRAYSIARVEFRLEKIPNAEEYAALDAISDRLEAGRKELIETRDASLKESRLTYQQDLADAQHDYDEAVAAAARTRDDAKRQANIAYVQTLWGIAPSINARLAAAETDAEKDRIWSEFNSVMSSAAYTRQRAEDSADSAYDSAVYTARTAQRTAQRTASREKTARDNTANSTYSDANTALKQRLGVEAQAIYDAHAAKKTAANQTRTQERQAAAEARDAIIDPLIDAADAEMRSLHGPPKETFSYYGWEWAYIGNILRIVVGENETGDIVNDAERINSSIAPPQSAAWSDYNAAVKAADLKRWRTISDLSDIQPSARGKFKASLQPVDSCGIGGDRVTQRVSLIGVKNIEIIYNPWSATGADFSDYYAELESEEEQGETGETGA